MSRLRDEYQPDDDDVDPYDGSLGATERRAQHANRQAELAEIKAAEADADRNIVDERTLQPDYTPKRARCGGRSGRKRAVSKRNVGRPLIGDESRSVLVRIRMTPTTAGLMQRIRERSPKTKNLAGVLDLVASLILCGDAKALLELRASCESDDSDGSPVVKSVKNRARFCGHNSSARRSAGRLFFGSAAWSRKRSRSASSSAARATSLRRCESAWPPWMPAPEKS